MKFEVTILGSSSATPSHNRFPTSHLLSVGNYSYLIDCGEGAQMQLTRYKLRHQRINCIFISHLHGDHYFGLFGLLSSMHLNARTAPLDLFGPPGLGEILPLVFKHSGTILSYQINFHPVETTEHKVIFENDCLTVESIPLEHRIACCGFLFREKPKPYKILNSKLPKGITYPQIHELRYGNDVVAENGNLIRFRDVTCGRKKARSYAYCSDTCYLDSIIPIVKGADLLYHEATFMTDLEERARITCHATAAQAATVAHRAGVGKLVIGHFSSRYKELDPLLAEAKAIFPETNLALEGETFFVEEVMEEQPQEAR